MGWEVRSGSVEPRPGLVWPVRIDPTGRAGPTRHQAAGPHWSRTSKGLYVPAWVDQSDAAQRIVQAAAALPAYGAVTGWAALYWLGARWFDGVGGQGQLRPVPLVTSAHDIRPQAGFTVSSEGLGPALILEHDEIPVTDPAFAAFFEMCRAHDVRAAVRVMDMTAYNDLASVAEVAELTSLIGPKTGIGQVRETLALSDENAWSPMEVEMRLLWQLDAGLPRPLCNQPVFDRHGNHLGTPDLLEPDSGVAGEYDSALHLEGSQRARDVRREDLFRHHGLEYFTMLAADARDPMHVIRRMQGAYDRARHLSRETRGWTIEPPRRWRPTTTVELRRQLEPDLQSRLLAHRRHAS